MAGWCAVTKNTNISTSKTTVGATVHQGSKGAILTAKTDIVAKVMNQGLVDNAIDSDGVAWWFVVKTYTSLVTGGGVRAVESEGPE